MTEFCTHSGASEPSAGPQSQPERGTEAGGPHLVLRSPQAGRVGVSEGAASELGFEG